jgi:hypothetical protein
VGVNTRSAAEAWLDAWTRGWRDHDADVVGAVYAANALFVSHPFREPQHPADYAQQAFAAEDDVEFWFAEPRLHGDGAAVEYWAIIGHDGKHSTLAGVTVLRFDNDGLVVEHRDYWALEDGARIPPETWPPIVTHEQRLPSPPAG